MVAKAARERAAQVVQRNNWPRGEQFRARSDSGKGFVMGANGSGPTSGCPARPDNDVAPRLLRNGRRQGAE